MNIYHHLVSGIVALASAGVVTLGMAATALANSVNAAVPLQRTYTDTYQTFVRRAETAAGNFAREQFARNPDLESVTVTVVGQAMGQSVPVLMMEVSRQQWRSRPQASRWATYFPTSETLLGFSSPTPAAPAAAAPTPVAVPAPAPQIPAPGQAIASPTPTSIPGRTISPTTTGQNQTASPGLTSSPTPTSPQPAQQQTTPPTPTQNRNPLPPIFIPAAPPGQLGLPRSILRP